MADSDSNLTSSIVFLSTAVGVFLPALLTGDIFVTILSAALMTGCVYIFVNDEMKERFQLVSVGLVGGFLVVGLLFWYPVWQSAVYGFMIKNPGGLQWMVFGILFCVALLLWDVSRDQSSNTINSSRLTTIAMFSLILGLVGLVFVGPTVSGMYSQEHLAKEATVTAVEVDRLPDSSVNGSRIAPEGVARNWGDNSLQYPQYTLKGGDITYLNGTPHWSYSLSPSGLVNKFTLRQRGAVYVNQSSMEKDIRIEDEHRFEYGQGMMLTDNYQWQLSKSDYLKEYQDPFVVPHEGESYMVVPYVKHNWEFRLTPIPQLYAVPEFGGVKVINQEGDIQDMSPEGAHQSDILGETQNYYPYELARYRVESMAYKNGIVNTWFRHKDQIEVAGVPGDGNSQPFTVPTEENGIQYFVAAEPWGENANGVYQIWMIDGQNGEMSVQTLNETSSLRGPRKAIDSVMGHPEISRLNNVKAVEPIPVVIDGELHWQVRIIPTSSARITYVAFFNAGTEEVAVVETTGDVRAFLAGQDADTIESGENDGQQSDCAFTVVVEQSDGSTDTICVPDGGSVTIEDGNATTNNSTG